MAVKAHIIANGLIMHSHGRRIINDELWPTSSSNSEGVAITQPRVEGRSASTLGMNHTLLSYSVRVAISRRRYHGRKQGFNCGINPLITASIRG